MATQYRKAEKPKIIGYFPTKAYGQDGDTVVVQMRGKGVFFCVKAGGLWYAQTTMQPLSKINTAYIKDLQSDKLTLKRIENAGLDTDKFIVLKDNSIKYRTGDDILDDLDVFASKKINFKTAYCSLGQYSDKESCEANGGTWYYSENDSHDSISSTAENQLLTTGQEIGTMDSEPTLLYDGSTLTVKHNRDYDNNWQTSEHSGPLIHIDYNYSGYESGNDTIAQCLHIDGDFTIGMPTGDNAAIYGLDLDLNADNVTHGAIVTQYGIDVDLNAGTSGVQNNYGLMLSCLGADYNNGLQTTIEDGTGFDIRCRSSANTSDYFQITTGAEGATTISTVDADTAVAHLTLQPDGDLKLTPSTGIMYLYDNDNAVDYAKFTVGTNGDLTLQTVDANASAANLTLDVDGDIELNADGGNITFEDALATKVDFDLANNRYNFLYDTGNFFRIIVGANGVTQIYTTDDDGAVAHLSLIPDGDLILDPVSQKTIINATDGLYFDGGTHTYIAESSDDVLDVYVGTDKMLTLDEANDKISLAATNWVAGTVSGATVTEFSAANSAYAGMVLGYTRLQGDLTNQGSFEIQNSLTVEDAEHKITFKTPPSELVEIEATFFINFASTSTNINVGLSDNSTYNSVAVQFEYDAHGHPYSDGEADDGVYTIKWVLSASHLASVGSSNTFYIGFGTAGSTKTAYLMYGVRATHGICDHPFIIKATALPAAIHDGL